MTDLYNSSWPSSFSDQKALADRLLTHAKMLYGRKTGITVNSGNEPSQGDWESAYVRYTGLPLPIPVGTKLIWRDLRFNKCKTYSTINDLSNGSASSGTVYPLLDMNYEQGSFRLLGGGIPMTDLGGYAVFVNSSIMYKRYGLSLGDMYRWCELGLDSIYIIYKAQISGTAMQVRFSPESGVSPHLTDPQFYTKDNGSGSDTLESVYQNFPGNVTTAASYTVAGVSSLNNEIQIHNLTGTPITNVQSYGIIQENNVVQILDTLSNTPSENYHAPTVMGVRSYYSSSISEANATIGWGFVLKEDEQPPRTEFFNLTRTISQNGTRIWVYGLFRGRTREL